MDLNGDPAILARRRRRRLIAGGIAALAVIVLSVAVPRLLGQTDGSRETQAV